MAFYRARRIFFALSLACAGARAAAEVVPSKVVWQLAGQAEGQKKAGAFRDIESWGLKPRPGLQGRPRALVTLANRGPKPAGAVVLRYAFSARVVRRDGAGGEEGSWGVPFIVEERRVPQAIGPEASREVPVYVNRVALDAHLRRLYNAGFWLDALRVQVMVEPRAGETLQGRVLEATLPIAWTPR